MKLDKIPEETCTSIPEYSRIDMTIFRKLMIEPFKPLMEDIPSASSLK